MRTVKEWIGKTDDAKVPPHVKLRVFDKYKGICYLSGRPIRAGETWELEHVQAICNGGEHRESNFAPALSEPHKIKTKQDRALKAKNDSVRKKHLGIRKPSTLKGQGFQKSKPQRSASKPLVRRAMINSVPEASS